MAIQQAGGAQAKIKEVAVEEAHAERIDSDGLAYALNGTWTARGAKIRLISARKANRQERKIYYDYLERTFGAD